MPEINSEQYPANSHVAKGELVNGNPKKVEKVIKGNVVQKKKTFGQKMARTFLEDDTKSVWGYLLYDVLIPAAKATISDMVSGGVEMLLFGTAKGRPARNRNENKSYVSYSSYYTNPAPKTSLRDNRNRARMNFDDIILETRWEAEEVLSHMIDLIENYGVASVADLYELVGITGSFTDNKYGWTNLSSATVSRVRDGYLINLPNAQPID